MSVFFITINLGLLLIMTKIGVLIHACDIVGGFDSTCLKVLAHFEKIRVETRRGDPHPPFTSINSSLLFLLNHSEMIVVSKVPMYLEGSIGMGDQV